VSMEVANKGRSARRVGIEARSSAEDSRVSIFSKKLLALIFFFPSPHRLSAKPSPPPLLSLPLVILPFFVSSFSTLANVVGFVGTPAAIASQKRLALAKTLISLISLFDPPCWGGKMDQSRLLSCY